jgi:hypothetical protein
MPPAGLLRKGTAYNRAAKCRKTRAVLAGERSFRASSISEGLLAYTPKICSRNPSTAKSRLHAPFQCGTFNFNQPFHGTTLLQMRPGGRRRAGILPALQSSADSGSPCRACCGYTSNQPSAAGRIDGLRNSAGHCGANALESGCATLCRSRLHRSARHGVAVDRSGDCGYRSRIPCRGAISPPQP